jgi:hypothetical protein
MANTTNFNWETPDDTDLVKDGAAAIRTLAGAIDTSLVDLKGGTTGQVLSKATGTDMDFTWVTSDDANAIQNAIVDAKGDLIAASANDTPARLAVGANGTVLTADSAEATGLKWAAAASGATFVGASVYKTAAQSIANSTDVALTFPNENFDTDSIHDNSTNNSRFTIPTGKDGKWLFTTVATFASNTTGYRQIAIRKNGSATSAVAVLMNPTIAYYPGITLSFIANAVATDYFEVYATQSSGGSLNIDGDATYTNYTIFQCVYLGA